MHSNKRTTRHLCFSTRGATASELKRKKRRYDTMATSANSRIDPGISKDVDSQLRMVGWALGKTGLLADSPTTLNIPVCCARRGQAGAIRPLRFDLAVRIPSRQLNISLRRVSAASSPTEHSAAV